MQTKTSEIAPGVYRFSTFVPEVAAPLGFTFNQFLIMADQPMLFHCGARAMFPLVSAAVAAIVPLKRLRWISFGHVESDECGSRRAGPHPGYNQELPQRQRHPAGNCRRLPRHAQRPPRHRRTLSPAQARAAIC